MRDAADALDVIEFLRANWALHARLARVSPNAILRSFYLSLLEMIESHTLAVQSVDERPLPEYLQGRYRLHAELLAAVEEQNGPRALSLIREHGTVTLGSAAAGAAAK
jgi:DNA-binding GntR family transcriptional regulator